MFTTITHPSNCSLPGVSYTTRRSPVASEDQRIHQAQNGNLEAFNELVLTYQDSVFRQALWILKEEEAAEDATQEAFLLAYRNIKSFHGGPFRPWLLKITTNYCIDQIRAAKRRPCQPFSAIQMDEEDIEPYWLSDRGDLPEKAAQKTEAQEEILRALQNLTLEFRLPVILVDIQDLDYEEASAVLHIPIGTFKSRLSRARQRLRVDLSRLDLLPSNAPTPA